MQSKVEQAREAIGNFVTAANPQDEFFFITLLKLLLKSWILVPRLSKSTMNYLCPSDRIYRAD